MLKCLEAQKNKSLIAKIDTGASISSLDVKLAAQLRLGPISGTNIVSSALGKERRATLRVKICIKGQIFEEDFTISDRSKMESKILIGQNILSQGNFLVSIQKKLKK